MRQITLFIVAAIAVAGVLVMGLFAMAQRGSPTAIADHAEVLSIDTVPLEGLSLDAGEFLLLADTTPAEIESGHVALSIPCEDTGGDVPETDVDVVAGIAPDVAALEMDYVEDLSDPGDRCTFHVSFPEGGEDVTDVAIINNGDEIVTFESGHFATVSLTTARADDEDDDVEAEAEDDDNGTRAFRTDLSGDEEVPPVDTDASGSAEVELEEGGNEIEYELEVQDLENVTAAHIHMGSEGENGDIVATLFTTDTSEDVDGLLAEGTISSGDLEGPLAGQEISDLIDLIEDGEAYVNVHTEQNPGGEIRGQLAEE